MGPASRIVVNRIRQLDAELADRGFTIRHDATPRLRCDGRRDERAADGILHSVKLHASLRATVVLCALTAGCALRGGTPARTGAGSAPSTAAALRDGAISETSVRAHMEFLAGDALNGRGSGTRDEWIAASYAAAHMRRLGLEPVGSGSGFVQTVEIEQVEPAAPSVLTIAGQRFTHGKDMIVSVAAPRVSGRLQKWTPGATVEPGAAVLMPDPVPADAPPLRGVIVLNPQTAPVKERWAALVKRPARIPPRVLGIPASATSTIYLDPKAYAAIAAVAPGEMVTIETEAPPPTRVQTWNAVGRLQGTDGPAARVILLSAHLDHLGTQPNRPAGSGGDTIFNGADDDASGTTAVLELMEAIAKGPRPKRTIVFALFGSEETGGAGSRFFAEQPTVPLDRIVANLQFEMIGRPDPKVPPHTLWLTGFERSNLGPELARRGARLVQDPHPEQNFFERSDNIQFARRGVIAHTVSSYGMHKEYHTPVDEIRLIDFAHMTDAIRSMLEPIKWLANGDFVPAWLPGKKP